MNSRNIAGSLLIVVSSLVFPIQANSQAEATAQLCNEAGVCGPIDPVTALIIIGVQALGNEINKGSKGFGPNGAVLKAINTVIGDLGRGGLGPNNDLVKAWETMRKDVLDGPGKNNDVLKALQRMGVKF